MAASTVFQFSAPATVPSLAATAPTQVVTTDPTSGVKFFAGEVDDPFFFDIPGFNRFVASVLAGTPDPTQLNRGRDTFAGYNIASIALSIPKTLLHSANDIVGAEALTFRGDRFPVTLLATCPRAGTSAPEITCDRRHHHFRKFREAGGRPRHRTKHLRRARHAGGSHRDTFQ